jgi:hypothetical protein
MACLLVWALAVVGLIQSVSRPSNASHDVFVPQLTANIEKSTEGTATGAGAVDEATKARVSEAYNKLPLRFEENRGQVDKQVKYISRGTDSTLFLTPTEAVLMLRRSEKKQKAAPDKALPALRLAKPMKP